MIILVKIFVRKLIVHWLSDLKLRLNEAENNLNQITQISARSLKAQGLSGFKLRLKEVRHQFDKFTQVISH